MIPYAKRRHAAGAGFVLGAAAVALLVGLAGCGRASQESAADVDCAKPGVCLNNLTTRVVQEPPGYRNVSITCLPGGSGLYVTSRGVYKTGTKDAPSLPSSVFVLPNDPFCAAAR